MALFLKAVRRQIVNNNKNKPCLHVPEDIAPKSELSRSLSRCAPALLHASQGMREAGARPLLDLRRSMEPGVRARCLSQRQAASSSHWHVCL